LSSDTQPSTAVNWTEAPQKDLFDFPKLREENTVVFRNTETGEYHVYDNDSGIDDSCEFVLESLPDDVLSNFTLRSISHWISNSRTLFDLLAGVVRDVEDCERQYPDCYYFEEYEK